MNRILSNVISLALHLGAHPDDDDDIRLRKSLLVSLAIMFAFFGVLWGGIYFALGNPGAGAIPFGYSLISLLSIVLFGLTRRYHFFRFSQLALVLLLPVVLMLYLGGFVNSSGVILWSFASPMGAMFFDNPRRALGWLVSFLGLLVVSGVLQSYLLPALPLSDVAITVFFVMNIGGVSLGIFVLLMYFVDQKNLLQERADNLLLNILPAEIATILKSEHRTVAEYYSGASVLFADIVSFTPLSAQMTPIELVELLNEIFSHFDLLIEQYGLEKIKTIGDCYMVASGVPRPRPDHAQVLVRVALDMQHHVARREFNGHRIYFRIGINSGPVVAGVIGRKKFIYDLWGDAVNTASRMESHGASGVIQITRSTYELIKDQFVCEPQGTVNVKGKGEMEVWHVTAERLKVSPIRGV